MLAQPLADDVRPAKGQRHQRHQLLQPLRLCHVRLLQTKAATLEAAEQGFYLPTLRIILHRCFTRYGCRDNQKLTASQSHTADIQRDSQQPPLTRQGLALPDTQMHKQSPGLPHLASRIADLGVGSQANAEIDLSLYQIGEPILADELAIRAQVGHRRKAKEPIELFQKCNPFRRRRAAFLLQDHPQQWESDALMNKAECQDVQGRLAEVPIGAIYRDDPRRLSVGQLGDKAGNGCIAKIKAAEKALDALVMRIGFGPPGEGAGDLCEVNRLNLDEGNEELRQEVDARLIPSYIRGKRPLKRADVGHRAGSFQDAFQDNLAKDSGPMAFYAFSNSDFCPVLSVYS